MKTRCYWIRCLTISSIALGCFLCSPGSLQAAGTGGPNDPKNDEKRPGDLGNKDDHTPDPIRISNGNNMLFETDLVIPCPLLSLVFTRAYNSQLIYDSPMGQSWCHSYDWFIEQEGEDLVLQAVSDNFAGSYNGDMRTYSLVPGFSGTNAVPMGSSGYELLPRTNGHQLNIPGGIKYLFDSNGVLQKIEHDAGAYVSLVYTTAFNDEYLLSRVAHCNGQFLGFIYSSNDFHIAAIHTADTNVWMQYEYDEYGNLTNAVRHTRQNSFTTQYSYLSPQGFPDHAITKRVNARGEIFHYEYAYGGGRNYWCTGMYAEPWDKFKVRLFYKPPIFRIYEQAVTVNLDRPNSASN